MLSCKFTVIHPHPVKPTNTGLGNVLFEISSTYGIAKKLNRESTFSDLLIFGNTLKNIGLDHMETIYRNVVTKPFPEKYTLYSESKDNYGIYDSELIRKVTEDKGNCKISHYLQSHKYFHEYRDDILKMFEIDDTSLKYIHNKYDFSNCTPVSLHVRHLYGVRFRYVSEYFNQAIEYIKERVDNPKFFVFSDCIEKCKQMFTHKNMVFVEGNKDYIDLWMMSLCKHNILSHSTLSWWGAYLNKNDDKIVIYPRDALRILHGGIHRQPVMTKRYTEHYFPEWICLDGRALG